MDVAAGLAGSVMPCCPSIGGFVESGYRYLCFTGQGFYGNIVHR